MKRFIVLFLSIVLVITLAACGQYSTVQPNEIVSNTEADGYVEIMDYEAKLSYVNRARSDAIYTSAMNIEYMTRSSVIHLPVYKLDTFADLERFRIDFGDVLTMDRTWDEVPSFNDITSGYDQSFFEDNTLFLVYAGVNNSTHRYAVRSIMSEGNYFCIYIEETTGAQVVDNAMTGWLIAVAVSDSAVETCTEFDAVFNSFDY